MAFPRPDDRWVRWLLVPAIVFISQATNDAYLVDFWHHLARGREMVNAGRMVNNETFTFTVAGQPLQDANWLSQELYYQVFSWGGLGAVRVMNALVLAGAWLWLVALCRREGGSLELAMAVGLATFLGAWQVLTIRPQSFSLLLFVGLFDILLRAEKNVHWLWPVPVFLAAWVNLHGAFPAGIMLVGLFWAGRVFGMLTNQVSRSDVLAWSLVLVACGAATVLNPYGGEIYRYVGGTSSVSAKRGIDEWLPPSWDQGIGVAFFVSLPIAGIVFTMAWRGGRRVSIREILLLACFGFLAVRSIRMVVWWLIVLAPMITSRLAELWPRTKNVTYEPNTGAGITVLGLTAFCLLSVPGLQAYNPLLKMRTPNLITNNLEMAVQRLREIGPSGNVFAKLEWGEYLVWAASPEWKVFMDGRIEIIPDNVWAEYATITRGQPGWQDILRKYQVRTLILDRELHGRTGLLSAVETSGSWENVFTRGDAVVYRRVP